MTNHSFIFSAGTWLGMGKMEFAISPEKINFYMKWTLTSIEKNVIIGEQRIEHQAGDEPLFNRYRFLITSPTTFELELEHELVGKVKGKGYVDGQKIIWQFEEFKNIEGVEPFIGFEAYTLQENGEYHQHAEYISGEEFRTVVDGRIWRKGVMSNE